MCKLRWRSNYWPISQSRFIDVPLWMLIDFAHFALAKLVMKYIIFYDIHILHKDVHENMWRYPGYTNTCVLFSEKYWNIHICKLAFSQFQYLGVNSATSVYPMTDTYTASVCVISQIVGFMGTIWGPSGADRTQVGPMLAPWTLLSGHWLYRQFIDLMDSFTHFSGFMHWYCDKKSLRLLPLAKQKTWPSPSGWSWQV